MRCVRVCCVGVIVTTYGFKGTDVDMPCLCCWVVVTPAITNAEAILLMLQVDWEHQSQACETVLRNICCERVRLRST